MLDQAVCLRHYKREFIQKEIVENAQGREVAVKFGDKGFGKRPDVLSFPQDVFEFVKKGVTSFHISEERWSNPLQLKPGLSKKDISELRRGWDLIIDIDSKNWDISRSAAHVILKDLKDQGVSNISVKFSGNKGFHIGIPFESMPLEIEGRPIEELFPEIPRKISSFILSDIQEKGYVKVINEKITFGEGIEFKVGDLKEILKEEKAELIVYICRKCGKEIDELPSKESIEFICESCERKKESIKEFEKCESCNRLMKKIIHEKPICLCGSIEKPKPTFNILSVIDIDTLLISSRHLYRSVYSLHEKSGLASIPIDPDKILSFKKEDAHPDNITDKGIRFLDSKLSVQNEALNLLKNAFESDSSKGTIRKDDIREEKTMNADFAALETAAPIETFPPCIKLCLEGLSDGKKRALFILTNFLYNAGWDTSLIENELKLWNERNIEKVSETILLGHLRYHKERKEKILPPNCDNKAYYIDMNICKPDPLCKRIKNPVNYTRRRVSSIKKENKSKKSEETAGLIEKEAAK